jgi:hypothetical protein
MVFITSAIDSLTPVMSVRKTKKRSTRLGSRARKGKVSKRASRKTKVRSARMRNAKKGGMTRKTALRKLREGRKVRFATRRTRVFKPVMASEWQVEHQEFGIGPLKKGDLSQYGYASDKPMEARHKAVAKAVKKYGPTPVFRKLNAIYVYNKNSDTVRSEKFKKDRDYVKKSFL